MRIPGADKAIDNLVAWSLREDWEPLRDQVFAKHFDPVCDRCGIDKGDIADLLGPDAFSMVAGCALEDFFSARFGEDDANVIDDYLKRRGWRETVSAKRYLAALRDSLISLYEVVDLVPGSELVVKDLIRGGDPISVYDKLGSETAARWDRLAARVVTVNRRSYFTGSMLLLSQNAADAFLEAVTKAAKKIQQKATGAARKKSENEPGREDIWRELVLEAGASMVTQFWLIDTIERALSPPPEVCNFEGDEIVFTEARYPLVGTPKDIVRRLDGCSELDREDEEGLRWTWLQHASAARKPPSKGGREAGVSLDTKSDQGYRVLGHVELQDQHLVLSVNSTQRAERGQALLAGLLEGLLGQPMTSFQTLEKALEDKEGEEVPPADIPADVAAQVLHDHFDEHYRETIDMPIPTLDGKSPREAVRSKKGRTQVVTWLKYLENAETRRAASQGQEPYDLIWMWKDLGVLEFRN